MSKGKFESDEALASLRAALKEDIESGIKWIKEDFSNRLGHIRSDVLATQRTVQAGLDRRADGLLGRAAASKYSGLLILGYTVAAFGVGYLLGVI